MEDKLKHGTTTVGIVCKDGIVLAADKRATAGFVVNKKAQKLWQLNDDMALSMAGLVSDAQLLVKLVKAELRLKDLHTSRKTNMTEAANLVGGMLYSNLRKMSMVQGIVAFLLAGRDSQGTSLYDLGIDGSITKVDDYVSDGSGSVFAFGTLESLYKKDMPLADGVKLAVKAINAAVQRDTATGNGIAVMTITNDGIETVFDKELSMMIEA